jgi:hypothetical protein
MKLTVLINEVNKDIDDTLDTGDITGWINRGLDDLSPIAKHQKSTTISLVKDTKIYAVPSDLIAIAALIDETDNINPIEYSALQMRDYANRGYKRWGSDFIIQPTPSEAKTLTLYYHARLPHLTGDAEPVIPSEFHDLLVLYAVARARYMDEEEGLQLNAWAEYQRRKSEFAAYMAGTEQYQIQEIPWG